MDVTQDDRKAGPVAYFALAFAAVFFQGCWAAKSGTGYLISPP